MADHKGKPPWNLLCDGQKGTNPAYREGYDRIFGKKPLPHGKPNKRSIGCVYGVAGQKLKQGDAVYMGEDKKFYIARGGTVEEIPAHE